MTTLSATLDRLAERHGLRRNASEPERYSAEHHVRCEAEYAEPLATVRREFYRRWGFDLQRKAP